MAIEMGWRNARYKEVLYVKWRNITEKNEFTHTKGTTYGSHMITNRHTFSKPSYAPWKRYYPSEMFTKRSLVIRV